jgi:hypothetical protein
MVSSSATAILLSYRRPHNIELLVSSLLCCKFISKVVVSNNNPELNISDWVHLTDRRLSLLDQRENRGCGDRWRIARSENGSFFIVIDDDTFMAPRQLKILFSSLLENPEIPHGVFGGVMVPGDSDQLPKTWYVRSCSCEVDVLHQVYAVTDRHVRRYFYLRDAIAARNVVYRHIIDTVADDIVISHAGHGRPIISDVGHIPECSSRIAPGVALVAEDDFFSKRACIHREIYLAKSTDLHRDYGGTSQASLRKRRHLFGMDLGR